jgi:hypothetical protein
LRNSWRDVTLPFFPLSISRFSTGNAASSTISASKSYTGVGACMKIMHAWNIWANKNAVRSKIADNCSYLSCQWSYVCHCKHTAGTALGCPA